MKAMILAGGMSTRLYPLTRQVPKPLVPIAGVPNSGHVMRYLRSFGIQDVAINVHYLADQITGHFGDGSRYGVQLHYLHEAKLLGSAGAVKQMERFFTETFVVVGCDDLTDLQLDTLIDFHRSRNALATIALVHADDVSHYGVVVVDRDGKIVEFQEKPAPGSERSHFVNTGIYVFEPEIFDRIATGEFVDFGKDVFPSLQAEGAPFYGLHAEKAYWCDIGTPVEYRRATRDVLAGRLILPGARATGMAADAALGVNLTIDGDVRVGSRARIGDNVRLVGPSVIGDGVSVGNDVRIERSIVWDRATIGAGAHLADAIVGIDYAIAAQTTLRDAIVANQ